MSLIIRDLRAGDRADAEAVAATRRAALPYMINTAEAVAFAVTCANPAAGYRVLVAEEDGEVVGTAEASLAYDSPEPGQSSVNPFVRPECRGRGAGTALLRAGEEYLAAAGATAVYSWVLDEPANRAFAAARGYAPSRSAHFLSRDLVREPLPPLTAPPAGVELLPASAFASDPRPLFEADAAVTADEPGDVPVQLTDYQDWLRTVWGDPTLDRELTMTAVVDGRVAAFSAARTDGAGRYGSAMTGTLREHRGTGLARLVKNASLHRARAAGCREAFTGNDAANGPMLAVNRWFGYRICATETRHVKRLATTVRTTEDTGESA
ncbi:GNAT family N-acetyltransferase [Streptomyces sp. NPDC089919]|uniref:GNAT family N-acetyltransferase n=1 Tax=Streptomyces sp. NPDC089919 TaxID=3155188 RepID=UPI003440A35F